MASAGARAYNRPITESGGRASSGVQGPAAGQGGQGAKPSEADILYRIGRLK